MVSILSIWCTYFKATYYIDEHFQWSFPLLDKLCGIVLFPLLLLILTEVALEGFLSPWAVDRVGNWGECRNRLVLSGVLEELEQLR